MVAGVISSRFWPVVVLGLFVGGIPACHPDARVDPRPRAVGGVLDLSSWRFDADGDVPLTGEYAFYWRQQVSPETSSVPPASHRHVISVPGAWNDVRMDGVPLPGRGYASYRLSVILPHGMKRAALKVGDVATSVRLFANGHEVLSVGAPGRDARSTVPRYSVRTIEVTPKNDRLNLVWWVSNFHHKKGGLWEAPRLGRVAHMRAADKRRLAVDLVLLVSMLLMGVYHLIQFTFRRKERHLLYFGLFCLIISIRFTTQGDIYLERLFPMLSWSGLVRIEYLSYYLAPAVFALFLHSLYAAEFHRPVFRAILLLSALFCGIVMTADVSFFSHTVPVFHAFTIVCCGYGAFVLFRCVRRKRESARVMLLGFGILTASIVHDIAIYFWPVHTVEILPFGVLAFVFCLSVLIARRFSKAFQAVEAERLAFSIANEKYERELAERKRAEEENKRLAEKLNRSQKMESIGLLAGGVAHDLNNILGGIVSYPDLLLLDLPAESPLRAPLETIQSSGLRAAAVVQDLLTLARRAVLNLTVVDLNTLIRDYLGSAEHRLLMQRHHRSRVTPHLAEDLMMIRGSSVHLQKVVMNLLSNAAESQPEGGTIDLSTRNAHLDETLNGYEDVPPGDYVVLTVADEGCGISDGDLKKIFEPFYTRKVMGRSGTGLGMAVVWGAVKDHQGAIDIRTQPDIGTQFEIYFPVTREAAPAAAKIDFSAIVGNGEQILVVDDIEEQRAIATDLLTKLGYHVTTVDCGEAAVAHAASHPVDLVLLDMIMPGGIDGLETYRRLIAVNPDIKTVIASGYAETDEVKEAQRLGAGPFLRKPYTLKNVGTIVKQVI